MKRLGRAAAAFGAAAFAYVSYLYLTLPDVRPLAVENPSTTAFMELRRREAAEEGRTLRIRHRWVPYSRISEALKRAVLVAEDAAFFEHDGVDLREIRAALEINWEEGRFARGASTITQQLAKNLYLSPSRNPARKLQELFITRRLEAELSKRRILEIYLNVIEWGDGIFGAEAAARAYFNKPAGALTAEEAALLAGAIINPRVHNPAHPTPRLRRRQQIIARRMGIRASADAPEARDGPAPDDHNPAANPPRLEDGIIGLTPIDRSDPAPPPPAQSVQPPGHPDASSASSPRKPTGSQ